MAHSEDPKEIKVDFHPPEGMDIGIAGQEQLRPVLVDRVPEGYKPTMQMAWFKDGPTAQAPVFLAQRHVGYVPKNKPVWVVVPTYVKHEPAEAPKS